MYKQQTAMVASGWATTQITAIATILHVTKQMMMQFSHMTFTHAVIKFAHSQLMVIVIVSVFIKKGGRALSLSTVAR